jgi:hypothetical protein
MRGRANRNQVIRDQAQGGKVNRESVKLVPLSHESMSHAPSSHAAGMRVQVRADRAKGERVKDDPVKGE